jgi:hypothetical protein
MKGEGRFSSSSRSYSGAGLEGGMVAEALSLGLEAAAVVLVLDLAGAGAELLWA